jgi:hypothetical protein
VKFGKACLYTKHTAPKSVIKFNSKERGVQKKWLDFV